jgi:membrane-associated phospholipid phosphatase
VVAVAAAFLFVLRYRWTVAFIGSTVILATLVLGIHWLVDVLAGVATGILAVGLALSADRRLEVRSAIRAPQRPRGIRNDVAERQLEPR